MTVPTVSAAESLWLDNASFATYPAPRDDVQVDVAVLGGGITGLTTALLLKREGARVAVLEATGVGTGATGCNTGKVTALQSTILSTIRSTHGEEKAKVYADASLAAVELVAKLSADEGIACDLERRPAFTYAAEETAIETVEQEADAGRAAGLGVSLVDSIDVPYRIPAAVRLDDQVEFQPARYSQGLAAAVDGEGSFVFEGTRALSVETGSPCRVRTSAATVTAGQVVDAAHYPLLDRGLFFARLEPTRSYCIAARVRGAPPRGLSISTGSTTRSLRSYGDLLIVGGEGHETGAGEASPARYDRLEQFARRHWEVDAVTHRWSAQDPTPYDSLPMVGRYSPRSTRLFVASGFMKWGLTGGTFAAVLLRDLLAGRDHPWASTFDPTRVTLRAAPKVARMNAKVALDFLGDRAKPAPTDSSASVPRGEARVVQDGLGKTGVYSDERGGLHAVSVRCTHLGCLLRFNAAERSWDCPCHGSRFDVDGAVLEGPATEPLERKRV
ncbi:MAG TPA: FAD-dependent oxidoreductase [Thermoleophilaceae bacterium]|nr:FAD-dependent oxidoreductase [Thermoleophilaceae bacterium]